MSDTLYLAATLVPPIVFAIVFHEVAHGWIARLLGDPTAQQQGRLSLNPLRHVDPFGTVILPAALKLLGLPVFGWAKPVPINYARLRRPKRDMALVAAAGPGINLLMAIPAALAFAGLFKAAGGTGADIAAWTAGELALPGVLEFLAQTSMAFLMVNLFLAMFNLLPLPPFDGSRILRGALPDAGVRVLDRIEPIGIPLFMLVFIVLPWLVPGLHLVDRLVFPPVVWLLGRYLDLADWVVGLPLA